MRRTLSYAQYTMVLLLFRGSQRETQTKMSRRDNDILRASVVEGPRPPRYQK